MLNLNIKIRPWQSDGIAKVIQSHFTIDSCLVPSPSFTNPPGSDWFLPIQFHIISTLTNTHRHNKHKMGLLVLAPHHLTVFGYCSTATVVYFIYSLNMLIPTLILEGDSPANSLSRRSARELRFPMITWDVGGEMDGNSWESLSLYRDQRKSSGGKWRALRGGFLGWVKHDDIDNDNNHHHLDLAKGIIDPEIGMTVDQIIHHHGYPVENHEVITQDGYILSVQRIPHGLSGPGKIARKPVLIVHCFLCSSAIWVVNTKDKNLPYILAESGYDVWLANVRGTSMGRKHVDLSPDDREFWDFSFDEMAKYDIPAIVDVMLNNTEFRQIFYIGHSIGTTIGFAILSDQPKFNEIFRTMFALAPAVTADHMRSPLFYTAPYIGYLGLVLNFFIGGEFLPKTMRVSTKFLATAFCNLPLTSWICENALFLLGGMDIEHLNTTRIPVFLYHTPDSSSVRNLMHGFQVVHASQLQYYDFGKEQNELRYKQPTPPIYNVSEITAPVAVFWGENDYLSDPKDIEDLSRKIRNLTGSFRVPSDNFAHMDFLWDNRVKSLVYDKIIQLMRDAWPTYSQSENV